MPSYITDITPPLCPTFYHPFCHPPVTYIRAHYINPWFQTPDVSLLLSGCSRQSTLSPNPLSLSILPSTLLLYHTLVVTTRLVRLFSLSQRHPGITVASAPCNCERRKKKETRTLFFLKTKIHHFFLRGPGVEWGTAYHLSRGKSVLHSIV